MATKKKKKAEEHRRTVRFRKTDLARLDALLAFYQKRSEVEVSEQETIWLALRDACKANGCEPDGAT